MTRLRAYGLALLALAGGIAAAAAGPPAREPPRRLQTLTTRHYRLQTDVERPLAELLGRRLDALYEAYDAQFRGFRSPTSAGLPRLNVYVYQRRQDYQEFLTRQRRDGSGSAGMFTGSALAVWVERYPRDHVLRVLRHEAFHQFAAARIGGRLPIWANEGLAVYFSEGLIGEGRILVGLAPRARAESVQSSIELGSFLPWARMLTLSQQDWDRALHSGIGGVLLYNQAWSMVHFLVHSDGGKRQAKFDDYLLRLRRGGDAQASLAAAFAPETLAALEQAWKAYWLAYTPDVRSRMVRELELLATALRHLHQRGARLAGLDDLYAQAEAIGYAVVARGQSVFGAPAAAGRLEWLASPDPKLPPGLRASGPDGFTVRVIWAMTSRGVEEELVAE